MIYQPADVAHEFSLSVYSCIGSYDPSGESIFEAAVADVAAFVTADRPWPEVSVGFVRVALTAEQVARHGLPTAPAKLTDSRSKAWVGETCQLEALVANVIADIMRHTIEGILDRGQFEHDRALEEVERRLWRWRCRHIEQQRLTPAGMTWMMTPASPPRTETAGISH